MTINIGDRYYCVYYNDVMRIFSGYPDVHSYYQIQWVRHDSDRSKWSSPVDGLMSQEHIIAESFCDHPLIKFETEQELLLLRLKYGGKV